jgi:hypothetical protein
VTIAEAVRVRLLEITAVTALVGQRVRVLRLAQGDTGAGPAIRVQRIGDDELMHFRGSVGVFRSRVQVDSVHQEGVGGINAYTSARNVDAAVHGNGAGSGLCGFRGSVTSGGDTVQFDAVLPSGCREGYDAEELKQVKVMRDYMVHWRA